MLVMNEDLEGALKAYLKLMDKADFFEAHEVLEEAWHPLRLRNDPLKNLLKGLINAAVSFEHLKRDRKNAAERARKVMHAFEKHKHLVSEDMVHAALFAEACALVERLKSRHQEYYMTSGSLITMI